MINFLCVLTVFSEGKIHGAGMLAESNFLQQLEENTFNPDGNLMYVYGNPAYPYRIHLQAISRNGQITRIKEFNRRMSATRVSVE